MGQSARSAAAVFAATARARGAHDVRRTLVAGAIGLMLGAALWVTVDAWRGEVEPYWLAAGLLFTTLAIGSMAWNAIRWFRERTGRARLIHDRLVAHPSHAVVSTDEHGFIDTFSHGAERLFGHAATAVVGQMPLTALIVPGELGNSSGGGAAGETLGATGFAAVVGAAKEGGRHEEREWTGRRADGTTFPARFSVTALHDIDREICGYLVLVADLSEARAAEEHRREYDDRLAKIASQVPGMVFQLKQHVDGRQSLPYASEGIRDIFGIEPAAAAIQAAPLWHIIHPDDRERVVASFRASTASLVRWQCEFRTQPRPGEIRWVWGNAMPEAQADGSRLWHGFIADITDRKRAEQEHEDGRAVLESILASVDLGVFLVDVLPDGDFRFVQVNPAYERLTGIAASEIRGRTPRELVPVIPVEMATCLRASLRRGTESAGPVEYEEPFFVRGRLLWWLTRLTPLRDANGRVVRLVGRSMDITERKAVEHRVQSLTERLRLAAEAAQLGIWDHDVAQNRLLWDMRMMALYGLSAGSFDGTMSSWRERVHPEDQKRVDQEYCDLLESRQPYNTAFRIIRPDGEEREIRARAHVQRNPAGRAVRVVGVQWDVTAERRAQTEIEVARDQAEDLNRQLEDALERAHRLAQEAAAATVAKSEFLANMSHEIRTPLNAIIGMGGLLLGTELTKDQREFAETMRSSGDGLLALVNDILDYSKIESGRLELEQRAFDLRSCVEASIDVLSTRAAEKKLDLVYTIDSAVPEAIEGDVTRLRQIIVNLLSNAVKFTAHGEVFLTVNAVPAQDSGRTRLRFAVHDSGIGIPADRIDRLFKTFSQVDASTTRQYGGTGLGLAISKRIVEVMGGKIWVESTAGKGSTFCFEIETRSAPAPTKPFAAGRVPAFAGRRLLIVDDNATYCRALCQQAVVWGIVPRAVETPAEALALFGNGEQFDAVLLDRNLGATNGLELAEQLRRTQLANQLPIGLISLPGEPRPPERLRIIGTVNKPIKTAALFDLLREMFQGQVSMPTRAVQGVPEPTGDRSLSILLAEDNPVNQRVAILMLERLGYHADVAVNGRDAVAAAERQRYDLILMDVQMPEMDGLQAAREICTRVGPERRPRIVAMTANASIGDRDRCLSAGMSDYLSKPVRAEDLRRALEETPTRTSAAAPAPNAVVTAAH